MERSLSLKDFYDCWKNSDLPLVPPDAVYGLGYQLDILSQDISMIYDNSLRIGIDRGQLIVYGLNRKRGGGAPKLEFPPNIVPGKRIGLEQLKQYLSCFEFDQMTKNSVSFLSCLLKKGEIEGILGSGATSNVYSILINGTVYAMKYVNAERYPNEMKITLLASKHGIAPTVVHHYDCKTDSTNVLITEKMSGSLINKGMFPKAMTKMAVEVYRLIEKMAKASINHKDLNLANILWNPDDVYKIIDYQLSDISKVDIKKYFRAFVSQLGFGSMYFEEAYETQALGDPTPYFPTMFVLFTKSMPSYLSYSARRAILEGVKQVKMTSIFEDFKSQVDYITLSTSEHKQLKDRFDRLVEDGLLCFPLQEKIDPEWYYTFITTKGYISLFEGRPRIQKGLYFEKERFYVNLFMDDPQSISLIVTKQEYNMPYAFHIANTYGGQGFFFFQAPSPDCVVTNEPAEDLQTARNRLSILKRLWDGGYSYGSTIFIDGAKSFLLDARNLKPITEEGKIQDLKVVYSSLLKTDPNLIRRVLADFQIFSNYILKSLGITVDYTSDTESE